MVDKTMVERDAKRMSNIQITYEDGSTETIEKRKGLGLAVFAVESSPEVSKASAHANVSVADMETIVAQMVMQIAKKKHTSPANAAASILADKFTLEEAMENQTDGEQHPSGLDFESFMKKILGIENDKPNDLFSMLGDILSRDSGSPDGHDCSKCDKTICPKHPSHR